MLLKTLILIRHAKSSWSDPLADDFSRPLNARGKSDAPVMASRLLPYLTGKVKWMSSPAARAIATAKKFAKAAEVADRLIVREMQLYHASPGQLLSVIRQTENAIDTLLVFGHNPGLTDFVNAHSNLRTDNVPTAAFVVLQLGSWQDAGHSEAKFLAYDFPKNLP